MSESTVITKESLWGSLFETYVFQSLSNLLLSREPAFKSNFWNIQGRHEVDFVIEAGRKIFAIEIRWASRWQDKDLSGLRAFVDKTPRCEAGI